MKRNVIILTHGWTGSSVFTALLTQAGYWTGDKTHLKPDYNTYENTELVKLNKQMMNELGYQGDHEHEFNYGEIKRIAQVAETADLSVYRNFVERCQDNKPWIWKDPRLTWTIRVWAKLLPLEEIAFIILTRDDEQAWISSNLRRHIQSRRFTREYNRGITGSLEDFLTAKHCDYLSYRFEDLLLSPEKTLGELNSFLDVELSMEDLHRVNKGPLYRKTRDWKDMLKASAIYLKNYRERYR
ncbi:MAG: sulfotransferase [Parahaliea sp.]